MRRTLRLHPLEPRDLPAVTAVFFPDSGELVVTGDRLDNQVLVDRDAAGNIRVNGGAVPVDGGSPHVANTALIRLVGRGGNDALLLSEVNGALPRAVLVGGAGGDTLQGGSGNDEIVGGAGADVLLGKGGFDFLDGGAGDDTLTGGDADDRVFGKRGRDRLIWNPGDDSDLNEAGNGVDAIEVNGGGGDERFAVADVGARVRFDRIDPAPFTLDIGKAEILELNMNGGSDRFDATTTRLRIVVDAGTGNDTVVGSRGDDTVRLDDGDDTFVWMPGGGFDSVAGGFGNDTLHVPGSDGGDTFELSNAGGRSLLTRDDDPVVQGDDIDRVSLETGEGDDAIVLNDLAGSGVDEVGVTAGSGVDRIDVIGTETADVVEVIGGEAIIIAGLAAQVSLIGAEPNDELRLLVRGGDDDIDASGLIRPVRFTIDGGDGNDTLVGSRNADLLIGGTGDDTVSGHDGDDTADLGAGDDEFVWNPGDDNDVIEGQEGRDELRFNGSNVAETVEMTSNAGRLRFVRNVANVTMDADGLEIVEFNALGGSDTVTVGDLSGTDVTAVVVNLQAFGGVDDQQLDSVRVLGTAGDDVATVFGSSGTAQVVGLAATVVVLGAAPTVDRLTVFALGGDDVVDATALTATALLLVADGGDGDDVLLGGGGNDTLDGGAGDDTLVGNGGTDSLLNGEILL